MMKKVFIFSLTLGVIFGGCLPGNDDPLVLPERDFRLDMQEFVQDIATYARSQDPGFIIVAEDGEFLLTNDGTSKGTVNDSYVDLIDGQIFLYPFYGEVENNIKSLPDRTQEAKAFGALLQAKNKVVFAADFATTVSKISDANNQADADGFISYVAHTRLWKKVALKPRPVFNKNGLAINSLADAQNFGVLVDYQDFESVQDVTDSLAARDYDITVVDFEFDGIPITPGAAASIKTKSNGKKGLILARVNIAHAEKKRFYFLPTWEEEPPAYIKDPVTAERKKYHVNFWDRLWQINISGNEDSYIQELLNRGYDGVVLTGLDEVEYWEDQQ